MEKIKFNDVDGVEIIKAVNDALLKKGLMSGKWSFSLSPRKEFVVFNCRIEPLNEGPSPGATTMIVPRAELTAEEPAKTPWP